MKTPFGKPMDTFTRFETEIRALVTAAINRKLPDKYKVAMTEQKHDPYYRATEEDVEIAMSRREIRKLSPSEEWFRVRSLLYLVEVLDKLMFYAARGSIFNVAEVSEVRPIIQEKNIMFRSRGNSSSRIKPVVKHGSLGSHYRQWRSLS